MKKSKKPAEQPKPLPGEPVFSSELERIKYDLAKAEGAKVMLIKALTEHQEAIRKGNAALQERDDKIRILELRETITRSDMEKAKESFQVMENEKDVLAYKAEALSAEIESARRAMTDALDELVVKTDELNAANDDRLTYVATLKRLTR